jgi:hypothetical protein
MPKHQQLFQMKNITAAGATSLDENSFAEVT